MSLRKSPTRTLALLAANRRNAQYSTGPRTEEGKRRVGLNSLKHGLRARSFRQSLIKSGESTALVDRNFLFYSLLVVPQKRYEVRRIADFVRLLWSVERWGRRYQARAGTLEQVLKNLETDLYLDGLLRAAYERVDDLERRRRSARGKPGSQSTTLQEAGLGPSESELDMLRRTGPVLLPGLSASQAYREAPLCEPPDGNK